MVVFTCNHCGESLQKPRVEKHYNMQCRRTKSLTCVDCFTDFRDEEYVVHIKCVTEEERYSAKGSIPGGIVKKGEVKQESWMDMIKIIVEQETSLKPSVRNLLNTISSFSNVPRKKQKFINFLKSSTGGRVNVSDIEAAWNVIEKYKIEEQSKKAVNGKTEGNGIKSDKRKHEDESDAFFVKKSKKDAVEEITADDDKFSFKNTILEILTKKQSISGKKLQKKVLKAYATETGNESTEKTIKKYNKKLQKVPNVTVDRDSGIVKLQSTDL